MTDQGTALTPEGECPERLTAQEREEMLHALGLGYWHGKPRVRWAYRNRFVLTERCEGYDRWQNLIARGFAGSRSSGIEGLTINTFFHVTEKGLDALGPDIKRRVPKEWRFDK